MSDDFIDNCIVEFPNNFAEFLEQYGVESMVILSGENVRLRGMLIAEPYLREIGYGIVGYFDDRVAYSFPDSPTDKLCLERLLTEHNIPFFTFLKGKGKSGYYYDESG